MDVDIRTLGGTRPVSSVSGASKNGVSQVNQANGAGAAQSVKESPGVSVKLTEAATLLHSAEGATRQQSTPFDAAKVAALKEAIASGRYHVDAERVAAKFMSVEPDL